MVLRKNLAVIARRYLARKTANLDDSADIDTIWKNARRTKAIQHVFRTLVEMSGKRERCMYCDDSRGTTIEHFWLKSAYRKKCFCWENMLLLCQGCQSHKGNRFDLDSFGNPLLINPTMEDPWDFVFFEETTGILTGRYDPKLQAPDPKGAHTTNRRTLPLNIEAVTEGRLRTKRNLQRAIRTFIQNVEQGRSRAQAEHELMETIRDNDDYGLTVWYFLRDGQESLPFRRLKAQWPRTWKAVQMCVSPS